MKDIKNYEGLYAITEDGKVWSYRSKKYLTPKITKDGYLQVKLCIKGEQKYKYIHRLVAEAYLENPDNLPEINHKDENQQNNTLTNIEWCDRTYNNNYGSHNKNVSNSMSKAVKCVETGIIYKNGVEAGKAHGLSPMQIYDVLRGKCKTAGKYHWERVKA